MANYTIKEAAKMLGLSEGSVRVYVSLLKLGKKGELMLNEKDIAILEKRNTKRGKPRGAKRKDYDPEKRAERYARAKLR